VSAEITSLIKTALAMYPNLRIAQVICNACATVGAEDVYDVEDAELIQGLKNIINLTKKDFRKTDAPEKTLDKRGGSW
jgi:hypothetical protein